MEKVPLIMEIEYMNKKNDLIHIEDQKAYITFHTKKRTITSLASL